MSIHKYYRGLRINNLGLKDYGPKPFKININKATLDNKNFRLVLWTGSHMQLTLMSLNVGEDIGLEIHPDVDQFIRIESGQGEIMMGDMEDMVDFREPVKDDDIIMIPAGKWHNLVNTGSTPLKLYSIYAPANHPHSAIHKTKLEAEEAERHYY